MLKWLYRVSVPMHSAEVFHAPDEATLHEHLKAILTAGVPASHIEITVHEVKGAGCPLA